MLRNVIGFIIIFGIVGFIVGYFIFGHPGGNFVPLDRLVGIRSGGLFRQAGSSLLSAFQGVPQIRTNILYSGIVGAVVGLVVNLAARSGRR